MGGEVQIAIVDDDRGIRDAVEGLILSLGYTPRTFASAAQFLAAPDHGEVSCLILDIRMPGMNGLELQDALRDEPLSPPRIFLSSADEPERRMAVAGGAMCVLKKPIAAGVLIACIEAALAA